MYAVMHLQRSLIVLGQKVKTKEFGLEGIIPVFKTEAEAMEYRGDRELDIIPLRMK